jgi:hypothetical protein
MSSTLRKAQLSKAVKVIKASMAIRPFLGSILAIASAAGGVPAALAAQPLRAPCTGEVLASVGAEGVAKALAAPAGLAGTIHGFPTADHGTTAVMSVRADNDFFNARQINLISQNESVSELLNTLKRNDGACIRGTIVPLGTEQIHVNVSEIAVLDLQNDPYPDLPPYEYRGPTAESLPPGGKLVARMHASAPGMLLVEVVDRVMPLVVRNPASIPADLYRFDTVEFSYDKAQSPGSPVHLVLNESLNPPIKITDSIRAQNGKQTRVVGYLALFPRSPLISRDTYAINVDQNGIQTSYTLVNFDNPEIFEKLQRALEQAWKSDTSKISRGRNYFLNGRVSVAIKGKLNMVSPSQANPQIIVDDFNALKIDWVPSVE